MKGQKEPPKRTAAEGQRLIAEYEASGQTRKAFCASRSISINTLDYWRRRCNARRTEVSKVVPEFVELTPLKVCGGLDIELELGDGVVLRLRRSA